MSAFSRPGVVLVPHEISVVEIEAVHASQAGGNNVQALGR